MGALMSALKTKTKKSTTAQHTRTANSEAFMQLQIKTFRKQLQVKAPKSLYLTIGNSKIKITTDSALNIIDLLEKKILPNEEVLTTQEVADLLNVSRPYIIKLIEQKKIPLFFMAGSQRRILKKDALDYREKMRKIQNTALDELTKESEDLGLDF
jgi:excisionase family DNA binding protein